MSRVYLLYTHPFHLRPPFYRVKHLSSSGGARASSPPPSSSPIYRGSRARARLEAGDKMLEVNQDRWEELHGANERNARMAAAADQQISRVSDKVEKDWRDLAALQLLVAQLPAVSAQLEEVSSALSTMESSLSRTEVALLALEDTIDAKEMQERQAEERAQVAAYEERRRKQFEELSSEQKKKIFFLTSWLC